MNRSENFPAHVIDRIQHEVLFKHITLDDLERKMIVT